MQSSITKFQILVAVFVGISLFGTVGSMVIEHLSLVDAAIILIICGVGLMLSSLISQPLWGDGFSRVI